jgi:hypothetical protein
MVSLSDKEEGMESPLALDETALTQVAMKRRDERLQIAHNKYRWDIVSVHAVNAAIGRLRKATQNTINN